MWRILQGLDDLWHKLDDNWGNGYWEGPIGLLHYYFCQWVWGHVEDNQ